MDLSGHLEVAYPMGEGLPVRCVIPALLAGRDWNSIAMSRAHPTPVAMRASPLALAYMAFCLSPSREPGDPTPTRTHPSARAVLRRMSQNGVAAPETFAKLVTFREAIGLSAVGLRLSYSWSGAQRILEATHVFPPAGKLEALVRDWDGFVADRGIALELRLAVGSAQLLRIHPFAGGNGKTTRAFLLSHYLHAPQGGSAGLAIASLMAGGGKHAYRQAEDRAFAGELSQFLAKLAQSADALTRQLRQENVEFAERVLGDRPRPGSRAQADRIVAQYALTGMHGDGGNSPEADAFVEESFSRYIHHAVSILGSS